MSGPISSKVRILGHTGKDRGNEGIVSVNGGCRDAVREAMGMG